MISLETIIQDFNPSKFVVHSSLLVFTFLFALRLDGSINWSYWIVFSPIWFWKSMVFTGAAVGIYVWTRNPDFRTEVDAGIHYKAMNNSVMLNFFLLMFELLLCDKMQTGNHMWTLVFIPLIFSSFVSMSMCIWAGNHDRYFELELFCAVNVLQFIFLALKLDGLTSMSWNVVFMPLTSVLILCLVGLLVVIARIFQRNPPISAEHRPFWCKFAREYTLLLIPALVFQVLLTYKLDGDNTLTYTSVATPLLIMFIALVVMSFSAKGGNIWWFGIRKEFPEVLLGFCSVLEEYGNIAFCLGGNEDNQQDQDIDSASGPLDTTEINQPVVPIVSLDIPD